MYDHALSALDRLGESDAMKSHALYLRGEALRSAERYADAIAPLTQASQLAPGNVHIWLALGWCFKRTGRIDLAIEALEQAEGGSDCEALVLYNLACYWSLAGGKPQALGYLGRAIGLERHYRDMVGTEPDFDPLRSDPDFQALISVAV
jgi:tetratricopeptide (TPR) repeat protein